MDRLTNLRRVKELLELALADFTAIPQVLENWPDDMGIDGRLFDNLRWQLVYLQNDEDIMQHEPEYRDRMLKLLRSLHGEVCERVRSEDDCGDQGQRAKNA
jgi:hypothetical protein